MEGGAGAASMRDAIQRELEKEMIREKIIREEVERFSVLEAQVRRELMIGREVMAMQISRGDQSFTISSPKVSKKEVMSMGVKPKPSAASLLAAAGSEKKMEWTCGICEVSPPSESGSLEHLAGKKHQAKAAAGSTELTIKKMEWRCQICKVNAQSERVLQDHLAGKKHRAKAGSTELNPYSSKKTMEWSCPICEVSGLCESGLQDHLAGKKHGAITEAAAGSTELTKKKMEWRCLICEVSATCERGFQEHLAGKKHRAKVKEKNI